MIIILAVLGLFGWNSIHARAQNGSSQQPVETVSPAAAPTQVDTGSIVDVTGNARTRQSAVLSWQASGKVGEVKVKNGDKVNAGDVLASLDSSSLPVDIITAQSDLVSDTVTLQDLQQSKTPKAQAQVDLLAAQKAYTDTLTTQQNLLNWTSQPAYSEAWQAVSLAQTNLDRARANFNAIPGSRKSNTDKARATFELRRASRGLQMAQKKLDLLGVPTQAELDKAAANTALALAQVQDAQRSLDQVANGPSAKDLAAAQARVASDQVTINSAKITAPFSGVVTRVDSHPGDLVSPGTVAFQIDDTSVMDVDLQVSEVDVNKVKVGQAVSLIFDAIQDKQYNGKVTQVSTVGVTTSGAVFYAATVQITNPDASIKPGMTAAATITVK